jgi:hypothetical protein
MTFRNPWIDPRVVQVRSEAAEAYLRLHGWKPLPLEQAHLLPFEGPPGGEDSPTVQVPLLEQGRDYTQRVIELITDLALAEDRYAVDVLNDILRQTGAEAVPANGPTVATKTEPAPR